MKNFRLADYLEHIQKATQEAMEFVETVNYEDFHKDRMVQQAVTMSLIIIGEVSVKISNEYPDFVQEHPEVPWAQMRGARNRMLHGYFDINLDTVWNTAQSSLPVLNEKISTLLNKALEKKYQKKQPK
ncbi:MAG: DUF86 domain-containing protein [Advenella sp.]